MARRERFGMRGHRREQTRGAGRQARRSKPKQRRSARELDSFAHAPWQAESAQDAKENARIRRWARTPMRDRGRSDNRGARSPMRIRMRDEWRRARALRRDERRGRASNASLPMSARGRDRGPVRGAREAGRERPLATRQLRTTRRGAADRRAARREAHAREPGSPPLRSDASSKKDVRGLRPR